MKRLAFVSMIALSPFWLVPANAAQLTLEGDLQALTISAQEASRADIVGEIASRFDLPVEGSVPEGTVSGRFTGSLSQILKSILPENGYAIAYREGRPSRISLSGISTEIVPATGNAAAAPVPPPLADGKPAPEKTPQPPTMEQIMERQAFDQYVVIEAAPAPDPARGEESMQDQIAKAQREAIEQLKALKRAIENVRPDTATP